MEKAKRTAVAALYAGGTAAVALLAFLTAVGAGQVLFPDAMLPMELRELASAWLAIGFLPMTLVSVQIYKTVRRKALFLPAGVCLLAALCWVGVWTVGMFRSTVPTAADGDIVLPEAEMIEAVQFTGGELAVTIEDSDFIAQLLQYLSQAENTGRPSVRDVPEQEGEMMQVDLAFKQGGASRMFLYWDDGGLVVEQPYQGIYQVDDGLEEWLRRQMAAENLAISFRLRYNNDR